MTATAQDVAPMSLVSVPPVTVDYMSRRSGLRLTMTRRLPIRDPQTGQLVGSTPGVFPSFRDGLLRLPKEGPVTVVDTADGGQFELEDVATLHEWLRKHRLFGDRMEGFWLVEQPPPPVSREELDRLLDAASRWDDETLQAMLDAERDGWGREDVIRVATGSLERIERMRGLADEQAQKVEAQVKAERAEREKMQATLEAANKARERAEARANAAEEKAKG